MKTSSTRIIHAMLGQILAEHGDIELWAKPDEGVPFYVEAIAIVKVRPGEYVAACISGDCSQIIANNKAEDLMRDLIRKAKKS